MDADTLIVGSAPSPDSGGFYSRLIRAARFVIAADAGLELCLAADRVPDVCVGDFDSVDPAALEVAGERGARVIRHPAVKDESDLDLAVAVARAHGGAVTVTAAFTGRLDHTLASLGSLLGAADLEGTGREPEFTVYGLDESARATLVLEERGGTVLSLLAPSERAVVSIDGVAYALDHAHLETLSSLGLSNVAVEPTQHIVLHEGQVLVLVNHGLTLSSPR